MYNPKDVFTKEGLEEHRAHLFNLKAAMFWLNNNADDLHMNYDDIEWIADAEEKMDILQNGDGETREDD